MKQLLFGPSSWRWQKEKYLAPFDQMDHAPMIKASSVYTPGYGNTSTSMTLSGTVLEALQRVFLLKEEQIAGGVMTASDGVCVIEFPVLCEEELKDAVDKEWNGKDLLQVLYQPSSGRFKACRLQADGERKEIPLLGNEALFFMAVIVSAGKQDPEGEAERSFDSYMEAQAMSLKDPSSEEEARRCLEEAFRFSNNLYSRVTYADACEKNHPGSGIRTCLDRIELLTDEDLEKLRPDFIIGTVTGAVIPDSLKRTSRGKKQQIASLRGIYAISDRRLTPEEELLVPVIPETYQITQDNHWIGQLIQKSTALPTPERNFLFVGEAGSGKTEAVKIQAYLANKPLLHQSMDPDTDKYDICQQIVPDGNGGFAYTEGPLTQALEKGWWCEVSEADLILKQGALGYLNPLLDKTGILQLNTGRFVKRHPEAVLFFTINGNYEGCRPMNKAVKDRLMPVGFSLPEDHVLIERIMSESGYREEDEVRKMVDVLHKVADHCRANCLDDGVVGIRSLIRWATAAACGGNAWKVAQKSIIRNWTFDAGEYPAIMRCVETQFPPEEVEL